jgi:hypothetical protein
MKDHEALVLMWIGCEDVDMFGVPSNNVGQGQGAKSCDRGRSGPSHPCSILLAMEPLHMMFKFAQNAGALVFLHDNCGSFCASLYDDAAVFIKPTA